MHSSVFGMHLHLGLFAQLSQSGRSESKIQTSQTKISALWAVRWSTRLFLVLLCVRALWRWETGLTYFLF